jgi:hypothetical protein
VEEGGLSISLLNTVAFMDSLKYEIWCGGSIKHSTHMAREGWLFL